MTQSSDSLFAIEQRLVAYLAEHVDEMTGEISDDALEGLDALFAKREAKLLAYGHLIKWKRHAAELLIAQAKVFEAEGKALRDRAKSGLSLADRLLKRAEGAMNPSETFEDDTCKLSWRQSTQVLIDPSADVNEWPAEFRRSDPSKTALKAADKAGQKLPDGCVVDTRKRLNIK
jgi:hypothetical protein